MPEFYAEKGVMHQKSCPDTPQQNNMVKSKHQHIMSVARSLRFSTYEFWVDCVVHAVYLIIRIPSPVINNSTPFELLINVTPTFKHLKCLDIFVMYRPLIIGDQSLLIEPPSASFSIILMI